MSELKDKIQGTKSVARSEDSVVPREDRDLMKRAEEYRKRYQSLVTNLLEIPNPHPDYDYYFFAEYVRNEVIGGRMSEVSKMNWEAVTAEEMPELDQAIGAPWRKDKPTGYIMNGGLVLHKRHKIFGKIEREEQAKQIRASKDTIPEIGNYPKHTSVGVTAFSETTGFMDD